MFFAIIELLRFSRYTLFILVDAFRLLPLVTFFYDFIIQTFGFRVQIDVLYSYFSKASDEQ